MSIDLMSVAELEQALAQKKGGQIIFEDLKRDQMPKSTLRNFQMLLDHYSVSVKYNEMSKRNEIIIGDYQTHADTEDNAKIAWLRSKAHLQNYPVNEIDNYIIEVGAKNAYHPVRDWIDSIKWDGQDRLQNYYDSIILEEDNEMKEVMMRKWALSLVACLYHHNFSCEGVLTFSGKQGQGKTMWVENLIPAEFHALWNKDGVILDMKNKDTLFKALSFWITELGELDATFKQSDIEALKGFLTEKHDILRSPYERKANSFSRRTVFYATVNKREFLQDSQNRRFWVLGIKDFQLGQIEVEQFWAQMKQMYMDVKDKITTGAMRRANDEYGWFMSPSERAQMEPLQKTYTAVDPVEDMLTQHVMSQNRMKNGQWLNVTTILRRCNMGTPSKRETTIAGRWLRINGFIPDNDRRYLVEIDDSATAEPLKAKWGVLRG